MALRHLLLLCACVGIMAGCKSASDDGENIAAHAEETKTSKTPGNQHEGPLSKTSSHPANTHALLGLWDFESPEMKSATYEFKADGTVIITAVANTKDGKGTLTISISGTYSLVGSKITLQPKVGIETTDDPAMQADVDKTNQETLSQAGTSPPQTGTFKMIDKDNAELDITAPDKTTVKLHRHATQ